MVALIFESRHLSFRSIFFVVACVLWLKCLKMHLNWIGSALDLESSTSETERASGREKERDCFTFYYVDDDRTVLCSSSTLQVSTESIIQMWIFHFMSIALCLYIMVASRSRETESERAREMEKETTNLWHNSIEYMHAYMRALLVDIFVVVAIHHCDVNRSRRLRIKHFFFFS